MVEHGSKSALDGDHVRNINRNLGENIARQRCGVIKTNVQSFEGGQFSDDDKVRESEENGQDVRLCRRSGDEEERADGFSAAFCIMAPGA